MNIQTLVAALVISCISSLPINTAINQSAAAQTAAQIRQLKAVGIPVVMPTEVPRGFKLTDFKVNITTSPSNPEGIQSNYDATYKGSNSCEIGVNGANGGWGAPGPVRQWEVNTSLLGKIILEEWEGYEGPNYLISMVLPDFDSGRGVIPGFPKAGYIFRFSCENSLFSPQQASQILKSMRIVQ